MISQKTATDVVKLCVEWCKENGVPVNSLTDLFGGLSKLEGNRSYKESTKLLYQLLLKRD